MLALASPPILATDVLFSRSIAQGTHTCSIESPRFEHSPPRL